MKFWRGVGNLQKEDNIPYGRNYFGNRPSLHFLEIFSKYSPSNEKKSCLIINVSFVLQLIYCDVKNLC